MRAVESCWEDGATATSQHCRRLVSCVQYRRSCGIGSKHSAKLQKEACWALAEYGKKAKFAVPALKTAAMSKDCPKAAKEALSKIAPGTSLNPMDMESDDALGLDDLL